MSYAEFIDGKSQSSSGSGFEPNWLPDFLFPFQRDLVEWSVKRGRSALFADCGLGKTPMQLVWAENIRRHTGKPVLIITPLAVTSQTVREAEKFDIEAARSRDGSVTAGVTVTNYEQLGKFKHSDYGGVVCDESSILKNFDGATRQSITEFMRTLDYRLLCTATPSPNDFIELGTSSEALGELGFMDMLSKFFKKPKRTWTRSQEHRPGAYTLRGHAKLDFWRWVCSWARSLRSPSDMGYSNDGFDLPPLTVQDHVVAARTNKPGLLFSLPAVGLQEQREERRRTIHERCEMVADITNGKNEPSVCWCHLNDEGNILTKSIDGAVQISGKDSDERKEEVFAEFAAGNIKVLVTKASIAGFGVNWQHCAHQTFFPSHSFEQNYQAVRRSWRFGQIKPVVVDIVTTEGEQSVLANLRRKQDEAEVMMTNLVAMMNDELNIKPKPYGTKKESVPSWL